MAVIGDVLGNFSGLRNVWDAIQAEGIQTIVQAGNLVDDPSSAMNILDFMAAKGITGVQGERDRLLARFLKKRAAMEKRLAPAEFAAMEAAHAALSSAGLEYLRERPRRLRLNVDGVSVLVCQGSVTGAGEQIEASTPTMKFQRQREAEPADVIICGGAPEPFYRLVDGTLFTGPGPLTAGKDTARYALVDTESDPWNVTFPVAPVIEA